MITVAPQTTVMWTVAVGVGVVVLIVVVILLNLLLQSVRALDDAVDQVWSSAVGVFVHTLTAAPQLRTADRHAAAVLSAAGETETTDVLPVSSGSRKRR